MTETRHVLYAHERNLDILIAMLLMVFQGVFYFAQARISIDIIGYDALTFLLIISGLLSLAVGAEFWKCNKIARPGSYALMLLSLFFAIVFLGVDFSYIIVIILNLVVLFIIKRLDQQKMLK